LEAGGEEIKIHKNLFGVYSDFFRKAFTSEVKLYFLHLSKLRLQRFRK